MIHYTQKMDLLQCHLLNRLLFLIYVFVCVGPKSHVEFITIVVMRLWFVCPNCGYNFRKEAHATKYFSIFIATFSVLDTVHNTVYRYYEATWLHSLQCIISQATKMVKTYRKTTVILKNH